MVRGQIALGLIFAAASSLAGQDRSPRVEVSIPATITAGTGVATTSILRMMSEGHRQSLLHSGWPTVIQARLELWKKSRLGNFDLEADYQWDVIVEYLPASKVYNLRRVVDNRAEELGEVSSLEAADQLLQRPFTPPLSPQQRGDQYFYLFQAKVSTLSLTDIDAWQRWLRGEAKPAVQGKRNVLGMFQKGFESALSKMLGGDVQTYDSRSDVFRAG
jgi:hypothetical protein